MSKRFLMIMLTLMLLSGPALAADAPKTAFPARAENAITGSQFIAKTKGMGSAARERAILEQINKGNIPGFLRNLKTLDVGFRDRHGKHHIAELYVLPDYMAIGDDGDFVRIPMTPMTAQRIANRYGYTLPTPKIVDEIYKQGDVKLRPSPLPSGRSMVSSAYYLKHQKIIEQQLDGWHGELVVGQKKDLVITNKLARMPNRVAIYGWHRKNGKPIQPLSLVHGSTYADYSHGVRLIKREMLMDGHQVDIDKVLTDKNLSVGLSKEGKMKVVAARTGEKSGWKKSTKVASHSKHGKKKRKTSHS